MAGKATQKIQKIVHKETKVASTKANPKTQSRCPTCGKYMRKKSG